MTYSVRQQLRRVKKLRREARPPKHWNIVIEEGEELTDEQRAQIGEGDTVCIREIPKGLLKAIGRREDG